MKLSDLKDDKLKLKVIKIIQNKHITDALITLKDEGFDIISILDDYFHSHLYSLEASKMILNFLDKEDPK